MPSQQLPRSSKVDTLPDDLKAIADRLIRKKFKIAYEPEVIETPRETQPGSTGYVVARIFSRYLAIERRIKIELNDGGVIKLRQYSLDLSRRYGVPFEFEVDTSANGDYLERITDKITHYSYRQA